MRKETVSIISKVDQTEMVGSLFIPDDSPKSFITIFHGMAEHRHRYDYFAKELTDAGHVVLVCDHRGHGDTGKVQGYFADHDGWLVNLKDLEALIMKVRKEYMDLPFILMGHSMGSLFARSYLKRNEKELNGVVLIGTPNRPAVTPIGKALAKSIKASKGEYFRSPLVESLSTGSFNKVIDNPKTDYDWISLNKDNVQDYINDPDCGFTFTITGYIDLMDGVDDVYLKEGWFVYNRDLPIVFFSGADDAAHGNDAEFEKIIEYTQELGYRDVRYHLYPNLRHELLMEKEKDEVIADILTYVEQVITSEK